MDQDIVLLKNKAHQMNVALNDQQLAQFDIYKNEILQWNAKINLISEKSSRDIITNHFLDSLTAWQFISKRNAAVIDVGAGAGFPGIPLKIVMPDLDLHLIEANRKKVSFLKHVIRLLNLSSIHVLHDRVENIIKKGLFKENFDVLISRAAYKLSELLPLGEYFLAPEGQLIALKGPDVDEEIKRCLPVKNHLKISQLIQYDIEADFFDAPRKIIIVKK